MGRTERRERDLQFVANRFKCGGGLQCALDERPAFVVRPGIVRTNEIHEVTLNLVGNQFEDVGQMFSFRRELDELLVGLCLG